MHVSEKCGDLTGFSLQISWCLFVLQRYLHLLFFHTGVWACEVEHSFPLIVGFVEFDSINFFLDLPWVLPWYYFLCLLCALYFMIKPSCWPFLHSVVTSSAIVLSTMLELPMMLNLWILPTVGTVTMVLMATTTIPTTVHVILETKLYDWVNLMIRIIHEIKWKWLVLTSWKKRVLWTVNIIYFYICLSEWHL